MNSPLKRIGPIRLSILVLSVAGIFGILGNPNWRNQKIIDWDISHYYSYLPATFIYHEYDFNDTTAQWTRAHLRLIPLESGGRTAKMTSGYALLNLPFFLVAHLAASLDDRFSADGFSVPYQLVLVISSLFYTLLGLWFLGQWLRRFFQEHITALVIVSLALGTNLTYYSVYEPMAHVYGFACLNILIYLFFRIHDQQHGVANYIFLGLTAGMLVLLRPTNLILLLFPLSYGLFNGWSKLGISHKGLAVIVLSSLIVQIPQLLYWKQMTGHWVVYSYVDEGFFFTDPRFLQGLFSYRKGWFVYSPVLFLTIPGFYFLFRKYRRLFYASLLTLFIGLWVILSWWCWWYGGGLGMRALIEFLPLMAAPLAASYQVLFSKALAVRIGLLAITGLLCYWQLLLTDRYRKGYLHHDGTTRELYWAQFDLDQVKAHYEEYIDPPDYEGARKGDR